MDTFYCMGCCWWCIHSHLNKNTPNRENSFNITFWIIIFFTLITGWISRARLCSPPLVLIEGRVQTLRSHSNARLVSRQAGSPSQSLREWIWPLNSVPHGLSKWRVSKCEALQPAAGNAPSGGDRLWGGICPSDDHRTLGNFDRAGVWQPLTSWRQFVSQSLSFYTKNSETRNLVDFFARLHWDLWSWGTEITPYRKKSLLNVMCE